MREADPITINAMSDVRSSKPDPSKFRSIKPNLNQSDSKKGGRNTLNPEAAARPMPVEAPNTSPAASISILTARDPLGHSKSALCLFLEWSLDQL